jgi:predicted signal transduction protein with EAL and GGDEF domain
VLCEVAERIKTVARKHDTVARLGGDEFAIVSETGLGPEAAAEAAIHLANRIITAVRERIVVDNIGIEVGVTIGIAQCPADGSDAEALLHAADMAMYRAKREGRGAFRFFEQTMDDELRARAVMEMDLRDAITAGAIVPYYQPLIELASDHLLGFEVLARWNHPQRGFIPPDVFIPLAEELGLISDLTFALLRTACCQARDWPADAILSVNISPLQLKDRLLPAKVLGILTETGFPARRLELEITENALVSDLAMAKTILASFQNVGIKVALDDFGTGYSSMYHLRELRFDKIKVDRSFIQSMRKNPESSRVVAAILGLTRSLGLPTIAEGIEDAEIAARLADSGCEFGQGFYFGRAMQATDAAALVRQKAGLAPVPLLAAVG